MSHASFVCITLLCLRFVRAHTLVVEEMDFGKGKGKFLLKIYHKSSQILFGENVYAIIFIIIGLIM